MPGSLTSVSGAGVMVPYGGTADGLTYTYAGAPLKPREQNAGGIAFSGHTLTGRQGAVLDLSGGGELRGAAFVAGAAVRWTSCARRWSTPIRHSPIARPAMRSTPSCRAMPAATRRSRPDTAGSEPVVGQTLTLTQDAGGLKAGVYTLMPAAYALMPGAYRVELGPETLLPGAAPTPQGSLAASGYLGVSNTACGARAAAPAAADAGERVRSHSNYNEMSHDAFVAADAARKGGLRGQITADARTLRLNYERVLPQEGKPMLGFDGVARFAAAKGGVDGTLEVLANDVELLADGAGRTAGYTGASLSASALNRFNPVRMMVGGRLDLKPGDNYATFVSSTNNVTVRGAALSAAEVFLISGATWGGITVEEAPPSRPSAVASRPTIPARAWYAAGRTGVLGLSNGTINLLPATPEMAQGPGYINIGPAAALHGRGHHAGRRRHLCWSPPTAPSRWPTMRAMVRATCCWRCPR